MKRKSISKLSKNLMLITSDNVSCRPLITSLNYVIVSPVLRDFNG